MYFTRRIRKTGLTNIVRNWTSTVPNTYPRAMFGAVDPVKYPIVFMQHWQDLSVIKNNGRLYSPDIDLLGPEDRFYFPRLQATSLENTEIVVPDNFVGKPVKIVAFSFNKHGRSCARSWLDPLYQKYGGHKQVEIIEITFSEYKWIWYFRKSIINMLRNEVPENLLKNQMLSNTCISFGKLLEFARSVRVPNKFTGYVCLIDSKDFVRWRASGVMNGGEVDDSEHAVKIDEFALVDSCIQKLLQEK